MVIQNEETSKEISSCVIIVLRFKITLIVSIKTSGKGNGKLTLKLYMKTFKKETRFGRPYDLIKTKKLILKVVTQTLIL